MWGQTTETGSAGERAHTLGEFGLPCLVIRQLAHAGFDCLRGKDQTQICTSGQQSGLGTHRASEAGSRFIWSVTS